MLQIKIDGERTVKEVLEGVSRHVKRKLGTEAVVTALTPILSAARANASSSVETGNLRDSLGFRVKPYRKGEHIFATVGPRRKFKRKDPSGKGERVASKYGHLVEFGHVGRDGEFVAAKPFMRPAFTSNVVQAEQAMGRVLGAGIEAEARRQSRKRARAKKAQP